MSTEHTDPCSHVDGRILDDLGENGIIAQLIERNLGAPLASAHLGVGDDAAVLATTGDANIVVTIDACPTPVVELLGIGGPYDWGRLAGVISLSDIAAMGAQPTALLSATAMPGDMPVQDYRQFLEGLNDVCAEWSTPIVGGNIREAASFSATTVALGVVESGRALRRDGAQPGDAIFVIGDVGLFWSAVMNVMESGVGSLTPAQEGALRRPTPRLKEARLLQSLNVVNAAMDCSDGVGAAVQTICTASSVGALLDLESLELMPEVRRAADEHDLELSRLVLSWGDWQLLACIPSTEAMRVREALTQIDAPFHLIGTITSSVGVRERHRTDTSPIVDLVGSKRFDPSSYLSAGLAPYVARLRGDRQ